MSKVLGYSIVVTKLVEGEGKYPDESTIYTQVVDSMSLVAVIEAINNKSIWLPNTELKSGNEGDV